jgi:hypothetical protein
MTEFKHSLVESSTWPRLFIINVHHTDLYYSHFSVLWDAHQPLSSHALAQLMEPPSPVLVFAPWVSSDLI